MFIKFFDNLRKSGIPVSLREYLTFLEALSKNIGTYEIENFYILARLWNPDFSIFLMISGVALASPDEKYHQAVSCLKNHVQNALEWCQIF